MKDFKEMSLEEKEKIIKEYLEKSDDELYTIIGKELQNNKK